MASYLSTGIKIGVACFFMLLLQRLTRAVVDPLRSVPGPFLARFTRLWYAVALAKKNWEITNIKLHRRYGPVFRVSPGVFSIDDPEAIPIIYTTSNAWKKSRWYYAAGLPDETKYNSFSTDNEKVNSEMRRKMKPVLDQYITYEEHIDTCAKILTERLQERSGTGEVVDLGWWITCYAFDVAGMITFSERFGHLDKGEDVNKVALSTEQRLPYATLVGVYPKLHPYTFALVNFIATTAGEVDYAIKFTLQKINEYNQRKEISAGPIDMLTRYTQAHKENPEWFTEYDLLNNAYANIVAGADSTWISLSAIFYNLLKYPTTLAKLRAEIDEVAALGKISNPITYREAQQMPYLQAVIKEGQRMWPATGTPLWRIVPAPGAAICGRFFPAGTTVGINTWVGCHNAEVFAPDPDTFRPERWLDTDKERIARMDRYNIPFGVGPRNCLGKNIALLEMAKLVPQIVKMFDIELDDSLKGDGQLKSKNFWLVAQKDFKVKLTQRKQEH